MRALKLILLKALAFTNLTTPSAVANAGPDQGEEHPDNLRRRGLIVTATAVFALVFAIAALAATGSLTQKTGTDGCISENGAGPCTDGVALDNAFSVTVSPDGKSAYVASRASKAVAVFDRDTTTGKLTQKPGTDACISDDGSSGVPDYTPNVCTDGVGLGGANSVTVSPDGKSAYVASYASDAVAVFDRNDGIAPTTSIDSGPSGTTNDPNPSFTFSANEPGSTFECKLDSEAFANCTSPKSYSNLPDGPHSFSLRATDTEGNTGESASRSFTVARPVPITTTEGKPKSDQNKKTIIRFSSSIDGSTFMCKLDKSEFKGCESPKKYKNLKAGKHSFEVYAISPLGAPDQSPIKVKFKVKGKK